MTKIRAKVSAEERLRRRRLKAIEQVCAAVDKALTLAYDRWVDIERNVGHVESQLAYSQMEKLDALSYGWFSVMQYFEATTDEQRALIRQRAKGVGMENMLPR